jgi:putative oxidoreductase
MMSELLNRLSPITLSLLRIVAGFLFLQHGLQELFGFFGGEPVEALSLFWFAGVLETILGPFLLAGLFTRPIALLLAGEMLAAYLIAHQPMGLWPIRNGGVVPLLFGLIFLHIAAAGGGAISLDALSRKRPFFDHWLEKFQPVTLPVVRIGAAFLFFQYGAGKVFGWFGGRQVGFGGQLWIAGMMEVVGAPLVALGLITRLLAFLFCGEMATAFWTSHVPRGQGFWPIQNGGEPAVLFCFLYLYLLTEGPGWFSLDRLRIRKSALS